MSIVILAFAWCINACVVATSAPFAFKARPSRSPGCAAHPMNPYPRRTSLPPKTTWLKVRTRAGARVPYWGLQCADGLYANWSVLELHRGHCSCRCARVEKHIEIRLSDSLRILWHCQQRSSTAKWVSRMRFRFVPSGGVYGNLRLTLEQLAAFVEEATEIFLPISGGWARWDTRIFAHTNLSFIHGFSASAVGTRPLPNNRHRPFCKVFGTNWNGCAHISVLCIKASYDWINGRGGER